MSKGRSIPFEQDSPPVVSIILVVRNAVETIDSALRSILDQNFPRNCTEIILVDGRSDDGTRERLALFCREQAEFFYAVRLIDNARLTLAAGWNLALQASSAELVVRFDAHSRLDPAYTARGVKCLAESDSSVVGVGGWLTHEGCGPWGAAAAGFYSSRIGGGAAAYRRRPASVACTDTAVFAVYRRRALLDLGGFNENLVRNQDLDLHKRLAEKGERLLTHPGMHAFYTVRSTPRKLLIKAFNDGVWVARAAGAKWRHFAPLGFLAALSLGTLFSSIIFGMGFEVFISLIVLHALAVIVECAVRLKLGLSETVLSVPLYLGYHLSYGLGTMIGVFSRFTGRSG